MTTRSPNTPRLLRLALVALPMLALGLAPAASAQVVDPWTIVFHPGDVETPLRGGREGSCSGIAQAASSLTGCIITRSDGASDCGGSASDCLARPRSTGAFATIYFHRTSLGCAVAWETGVEAKAGGRYNYEHGLQTPYIDQRGALGREGPFADGHAGVFVLARGGVLTVQAWIVKTDGTDRSDTGKLSFTC